MAMMTVDRAPSADLARACEAFAELLDLIGEDQWASPTPCAGWTVRDLVAHVVAGNRKFVALLGHQPPVAPHDGEQAATGPQLRSAFHTELPGLLAAFDAPGALTGLIALPVGTSPGAVALRARTTDVLVHGWDLARALGVSAATLPADLASSMLEFVGARRPDLPPDRFAAAQPCSPDAAPIERLAALLGRTP